MAAIAPSSQPLEEPSPMTRPERFLTRMILFLVVVGSVTALLFPALRAAFMNNPALNGLILGTLLAGILFIFRQVLMLRPEVAWLEHFQSGNPAVAAPEPVLLAPMARMLRERRGRLTLSALSMRSLLDGIASRLDESRELSRYLIGLLIFLGLLGTFWGLLHTVQSVGSVIGGLSVQGGDVGAMFSNLQHGLEAPLTGMGTAFSSSLFGLAGSLVLGFLELQASQAHNRFFQDVEDWLSGATRLSSGAGGSLETGDQSMPAYLTALLEQTAENLDSLQRTVATAEEGRRSANANLMALTERLSTLTDQMRAEQQLLLRLGESQLEMKGLLDRLSDAAIGGFDDASRQHLRNMDIYLARMVEESSTGRVQAVQEIRSEIKLLARTIAALAEESEQR
ncbi:MULTISPECIES: flagellar motor protein MotA [Alphaproteobacteria]|uniref:Flagellar motor protein MotA n=1 Tax=Roseomonas genomospecies 6 TaxID=214106 RepID=A0A9W7NN01_9PROT|nr:MULTISPECIES: flagellar motor protein MotA [Rhodospirillales]KAA0683427.1 flagellar motor protein MotA [Roseomonas genomospecies 6]NUB28119.1 flagellar motor protein MotA [Azospirillum brasilense]NUB33570.1 flagellar motor protein MotA [Azospirillum brasilense]RIV97133.1 flagellar motor protein MotA [Azospirillum brasilense]UKJ72367.1 flagellar motor protein MotA [Azospirillum brasilense]